MCVCVLGGEAVWGASQRWWGLVILASHFSFSPLCLVSSSCSVLLELQKAGCSCCDVLPKQLGLKQIDPHPQAELLSDRRPSLSLKGARRSVLPHFTHFGLLLHPHTLPPQLQIPPHHLMCTHKHQLSPHSSSALSESDIIR